MVSSNPCVGPSPKTKIFSFLSSVKKIYSCTDEPILAPKIITFLPQLPSDHENCERTSYPIT